MDELRLLVYPLVLGRGRRLFAPGDRLPLTLVSSRQMSPGVMLLVYGPASASA